MSAPAVSILLPVWNGGAHLRECLASISDQTFSDWECLCVDDGSTDDSLAILNEAAVKDPRFISITSAHVGLVGALRIAENRAKGRAFCRMDQDDLMDPRRLGRQWQALDVLGPRTVVTGRVEAKNPLGPGFEKYVNWLSALQTHRDHEAAAFLECPVPSPSWMMRRDEFLEIGGHQAVGLPEDYELVFRWLAAGIEIAKIEETILWWRDHPSRASRTLDSYADPHFWPVKVRHLESVLGKRRGKRTWAVWGFGHTAKGLLREMTQQGVAVGLIATGNERKQNQTWQGIPVEGPDFLDPKRHYVLTAAGGRGDFEQIRAVLEGKGFEELNDFVRVA